MKPRVLISGAGIAGLALARRLKLLSIDYVLLEKRKKSNDLGTGIALPFNAIQALRELGLAKQVLEVAHQVHEVTYTTKNGTVLGRASLNEPPLNQDNFVAMLRSDLYDILLDGIEKDIHFETTIEEFNLEQSTVSVRCSKATLNGEYDLVVCAEGINSTLRQQCFPGEVTTVDFKIPNWRFLVDYPNHNLQPVYMFDRTELFMAYPIHPDRLYCYAHVYDESGKYDRQDPHQFLHQLFGKFGGEVGNILARLGDRPVLSSRLRSVNKPYYSHGRIVFIGDAGNACSPLLQQGAASAFEDAICLAEQLQNNSVEEAILGYQRIRAPKVEWVLSTSDNPIKKIKVTNNPIAAFVRNMIIRRIGPLNARGWKKLANFKKLSS